MRYMLMICTDPAREQAERDRKGGDLVPEYAAFSEEMAKRGVRRGGERLRPAVNAKTVQVQNGKVLASDGPFAETKEQLGGYFIVDCKDVNEAVEVAAKIPGARYGKIEVRPIWET